MKRIAIGLALGLVVALPASTLAASSGSVSESFSVNSTLAVVLSRTTINYGAIDPGGASAPQSLTVTWSSNIPAIGRVYGSDFTGPETIPASVRQYNQGFDWGSLPLNIALPQGTFVENYNFRVNLAGLPTVKAGTYTGTIDFQIVPVP